MPIYIFTNEKTGEVKQIIQGMNDNHVYFENGLQWQRIFTVPRAAIDMKVDPFNKQDYLRKTETKSSSIKDLEDRSRELSEKRAQIAGVDPVKQNYYNKWSKTRKGKKHPDILKKEAKESLNKMGVSFEP